MQHNEQMQNEFDSKMQGGNSQNKASDGKPKAPGRSGSGPNKRGCLIEGELFRSDIGSTRVQGHRGHVRHLQRDERASSSVSARFLLLASFWMRQRAHAHHCRSIEFLVWSICVCL